MTHELENFITYVLTQPPSQEAEEVGSDIHETHRIPDPYLYVDINGKLHTPGGILVESKILTKTFLQQREMKGFLKIQDWVNENDSGYAVWFSPALAGTYDTSKFIISQIITTPSRKILFNRAVLLDIHNSHFLTLANSLGRHLANCEELRENPVFPKEQEFITWFSNLSLITGQAQAMQRYSDLAIKTDTYATVADINKTIAIYGEGTYQNAYQASKAQGLIGPNPGSCGSSGAFETMLNQAKLMGEYKILKCNCPMCKRRVDAVIIKNRIFCPKCKASASYKC